MRVVGGNCDVGCALREMRECVEEDESVLGRSDWVGERLECLEGGCAREKCCEMGRSGNEPESARMWVKALGSWTALVMSGGSVGGVSATRSSCRSGERRTSFRGERGECGVFHWFASAMMGLDISRGLSFLAKRRKIDAFLNSGGGCAVSTIPMTQGTFASLSDELLAEFVYHLSEDRLARWTTNFDHTTHPRTNYRDIKNLSLVSKRCRLAPAQTVFFALYVSIYHGKDHSADGRAPWMAALS